jgi:tRNA dimethylallyltransferase
LVLVGPTAAGKTELSLTIARSFDGEVISADSRQFYRGMDIGTAKPSPAQRTDVPHHLIDICEPDLTVTLGEYQRLANRAIEAVLARGRLPILVGGTGQYVMAVVEGWGVPAVAPRPRLRRALGRLGEQELSRWLSYLDPQKGEEIDARNVRRVVRALEVVLTSGRAMSDLQRKQPPDYDILILGLAADRQWLYDRIDARVDAMMADGLLDEVRRLREAGLGKRLPAISGLGYRQLYAHLAGEMPLETAVERIKFETHRFARQQNTWFRQDDGRIHWLSAESPEIQEEALRYVTAWLAGD